MTITPELMVAYRDVGASDLRLRLGAPIRVGLTTRTMAAEGWTVQLRILAASHQVVLDRDDAATRTFTETVSCDMNVDDPGQRLPVDLATDVSGAHYRCRATVQRFDSSRFDSEVETLLADLADQPGAFAATYPGRPLAATALRACIGNDRVVSWQTWHTYPQSGEVVFTDSRLAPAPVGDERR